MQQKYGTHLDTRVARKAGKKGLISVSDLVPGAHRAYVEIDLPIVPKLMANSVYVFLSVLPLILFPAY
jgi:hypothetical protein